MATPLYFDFNVYFKGMMVEMKNIDPLVYSYINLLEDVTERCLSILPCNIGYNITLWFQSPRSNEKIVVGCDLDVLDMFKLCSRTCLVDLFVEVSDPDGLGYTLPIGPQVDVNVNEFAYHQVDVQVNEPMNSEIDFSGFNVRETIDEVDITDGEVYISDPFGVWAEGFEIDSDQLSSYQSDDEGGRESCDEGDDNDHGDSGSKFKGFDSSTFGHEFYVEKEGPIKFEVGMLFGDVNKFRVILKEYTIQQGCKIIRDKNERGRVTCHCASLGCEWRIHASPLPDGITYKIRSYKGEHTCLASTTSVEANSTWIAKKFAATLRANPTMTLAAMQAELQQKFGIEASRIQLYRAKRKAMEEIEGNHGTSYAKLPTYAAEVRKSNPGSLVKIQCYRVNPPYSPPVFERIFIAFEAMKTGFSSGCRPFIGIDGCHLKGPYGGVLLSAIALDGNNGLFPIAVGVVESEGRESWGFFLDHLHTLIGGDAYCQPLTFMTDQQKGIDKVITEIMPEASHRLCCRHLFNNFKKVHPGLLLKTYFWQAARAYTHLQFQQTMEMIKIISNDAHTWLSKVPVTSWSRHAFDDRLKNDHITNNLAESFNNWVGPLRYKPILSLLEGIRTKLMTRLRKRHDKALSWPGNVGPNIRKRITKATTQSRFCTLFFAGGGEYEILENGMTYQVHIDQKRCSCREWQIAGIPCKHAVAAITHKRGNIEEGCDLAFFKETYLTAHGGMIHPIPDQRHWVPVVGDQLEPPPLRRLPGRPRKNRRREVDEAPAGTSQSRRSQTIKCSVCQEFGHNKRSCQRAPVAKKKAPPSARVPQQGQQPSSALSQSVLQVEGPSRGRGNTGRGRERARGSSLGRGSAGSSTVLELEGQESQGSQAGTQVDNNWGSEIGMALGGGRGRGVGRGRGMERGRGRDLGRARGRRLGRGAPISEYAQF